MNRVKPAGSGELFVLLGIYIAVMIAAVALVFVARVPAPWRSLVILVPLLPAVAIVRWEVRALSALDEMLLRNQIVALVWTFAISATLMAAYALLEAVGWPRLPMWVVFMTMMLIRSGCSLTQWRRYR